MVFKSILNAVCACLTVVSFNTNAEIVRYVLTGKLDHMTDRVEYYQTDLYDLDGAYYTREMIVDTSVPPDAYFSGETTVWFNDSGFLVSNVYHIIGRPNGAPDLHINASSSPAAMTVQNAFYNGHSSDFVSLGSGHLTGVLEDLFASDEFIVFHSDVIPGDEGYVTEPPYPFDDSDIQNFNVNVWNYAPGGSTGTIDGKYLQYYQTVLSAHASPVPNPSAVTWEIKSEITSIETNMVGYANIGDVITLRYTFDSETPDAEPGVVERASYDGAILSSEVFLNSDYARLEHLGYIKVFNDFSPGEDIYGAYSGEIEIISERLQSYNGFEFSGYSFTYKDIDETMFNNTNLTTDPIISGYDSLSLTLHFRNPLFGSSAIGSSITANNLVSITRVLDVLDYDIDGIANAVECPSGPPYGDSCTDTDGDGLPDFQEIDSDNDDIIDAIEVGLDNNNPIDSDGDGTPDYQDTDSDNDGIDDVIEGTIDTDGDGVPDYVDVGVTDDSDGDGIPDIVECPTYPNCPDSDGDSTPDYLETDSDNDGIDDSIEAGVNSITPIDTDGDGTPDYQDTDSDNEGADDSVEGLSDIDGDGIPDYVDAASAGPGAGDSDGDGITDNVECEVYPLCADSDADGTPDYMETDSDSDGINDAIDNCPAMANTNQTDTDTDGQGNACDSDDDNDGLSDVAETVAGTNPLLADTDYDGVNDGVDAFPLDSNETEDNDVDGIGDTADNCPAIANTNQTDTDADGQGDACDSDDDNDGVLDQDDAFPLNAGETTDTDGDSIGNNTDKDDDGDGVNDDVDAFPLDSVESTDSDLDGIGNVADTDDDNDGVLDQFDGLPLNPDETTDTDSDGIGNNADEDDDNDGVLDTDDAFPLDPTRSVAESGGGSSGAVSLFSLCFFGLLLLARRKA